MMPSPRIRARAVLTMTLLLPIAARCAATEPVAQPPEILIRLDAGFDAGAITGRDATATLAVPGTGAVLRMVYGHTAAWPGIDLPAPQGHWDLSHRSQVAVDLRNPGTKTVNACLRVDNPGADGIHHCLSGHVRLPPAGSATLRIDLPPAASGTNVTLFGMRGYPWGASSGKNAFSPSNTVKLVLYVDHPQTDGVIEATCLRAEGAAVTLPSILCDAARFFPFIDTFGQYIHRDWPGKTHTTNDLAATRASEDKALQSKPGPADWDRFGGWQAGPQLPATGFFRPLKYGGRWWLVDPDGRLFWSHGIDCVGAGDSTPMDERASWFSDLPPQTSPLFAACYSHERTLHGHYQGQHPLCFSFLRANLIRKYGADYQVASDDMAHRRLRSWGLNTIGNWSDSRIRLQRRTPYTTSVWFESPPLRGSTGYWGKFRDVFDPAFAQNLRQALASEAGKSLGDPWCVGYFVDNELGWGNDTSLAVAALASPADQPAKQAFVADLKARYDNIARLNATWDAHYATWEELLAARQGPPDAAKARPDLLAFYTRTADTYFGTCRDAIRAAATNQLFLGCRFADVNEAAAMSAARFCDVVSFNLYRPNVGDFRFPGKADVPLLIGEWHLGALDRGMFHTGLVPVASQRARADGYLAYVTSALCHPQFVGCHWFKYSDESVTGRPLDEENYQIGFLDVADTPYDETVAACRDVGARLYAIRTTAHAAPQDP